jgi:hypothetical protein
MKPEALASASQLSPEFNLTIAEGRQRLLQAEAWLKPAPPYRVRKANRDREDAAPVI